MSELRVRDRAYARRLCTATAAALALHAAAWLLPSPRRPAPRLGQPDPFPGMGLIDVFVAAGEAVGSASGASRDATPAEIAVPIVGPADPPPTEVTVETTAPPITAAIGSSSPSDFDHGAGSETAGPGGGSNAGGGSQSGTAPGMQILSPRFTVHPRIPDVVVRRKIDDFVMLELLVGTDGRVELVRVSHAIDRCEECTASAIEAARKFEYEPPMLDGRSARAWTTFSFTFTFRQRR